MGQKFCTACGAALSDGLKFCENCGSPVTPDTAAPVLPAVPPGLTAEMPPAVPPLPPGKSKKPVTIIAAVFLVILIAAGAYFFVLPALFPGSLPGILPGSVTSAETTSPAPAASRTPLPATTAEPTLAPDPFPKALGLKDRFDFGSEKVASEAVVYKYWINDTYEWHNDKDNHYYVQKPGAGNKFLFVFVHLQNNGDTRVWFPPAGNVQVWYNGATYSEDRSHYKPDKATDEEATPIEVKEVMYIQKLNGDEYVEDFGFSHGTELAYLYPGKSNAVDGYIVYQVPQSLRPEETYVIIPFNGQDRGVWKLG